MKQNGYTSFAGFYDRLTSDVDYAGAAAYLLGLFRLHGGRTDTLLDLACGSGSLSLELARQGADIIGVDGSEDMLALAQEKAAAAGLPLLFLHQDMRALDLYGTVSGAVCTLDSLNHILRTQELEEILRRLHLFVDPEGLLIFDAIPHTSTGRYWRTTILCMRSRISLAFGATAFFPGLAKRICCWISLWKKQTAATSA